MILENVSRIKLIMSAFSSINFTNSSFVFLENHINYVTTANSKQTLDLKNIYVYWNPLSRGEILLGFVFHHTDYKLRGGIRWEDPVIDLRDALNGVFGKVTINGLKIYGETLFFFFFIPSTFCFGHVLVHLFSFLYRICCFVCFRSVSCDQCCSKASRKSITGSSHLIVWEVIFQFIPASQFWIVEWFVSTLMIVAVSLYVYE
jgi:hypothetical protein